MGMDQNNIPTDWICPGCGEQIEKQFGLCWNCGTNPEGEKKPDFPQSGMNQISTDNVPSASETTAIKPGFIIAAAVIIVGAGIGMAMALDAVYLVFLTILLAIIAALAVSLVEHIHKTDEQQRKKYELEDRPICNNCLKDNEPLAHFCSECATPLTSHATIDPMGSIYAMGDTYRKAAGHPHKLIIVIAMWLIFGPMIIMIIDFMAPGSSHVSYHGESPDYQSLLLEFFTLIFSLGFIVLYSAILFKVTANYLKEKDESEKHSPTDHSQPVA
jgi:membrane protein implicated in regulation of membrane protease activity